MLKYCIAIIIIFSGKLFAQSSSNDAACIPSITIATGQNTICLGTAATFHASVTNNGTSGVFKWKKNNVGTSVNETADYTLSDFHDGDIVQCEYSCKTICGIDTTVISNPVTMHVSNDITPTITIANTDSLICEGELTVFTAKSFYGNAAPSYQWLVNGSPVGTDSPVFSTSTITNGSRVECVLTITTPSCPGVSKSTTSQMTIYVYPLIHPAIKITPSKTEICREETVTFTATANGGAYPTFTWKINDTTTANFGPSLTTSMLKDGDKISCTVTIDQDSRCHTSTSAPSNDVVMHVHDFTDPTLMIAASILDICEGSAITFTAIPQNAGNFKSYHWQVNGRSAGNHSPTFIYNEFANGDQVSCTLTTDIPGCTFTTSVPSNSEVVTVRKAPEITFSPPVVTVMEGEATQVQATVSGNPASVVWKPEGAFLSPHSLVSTTTPLVHDTIFTLNVVDSNGCTANKELVIKILHKLYMPTAFTPNKDGKNDIFRIPPGASISLQEFLIFDRWGHIVFRTNDITKGWNGTYQGQNLDIGNYVYLIKGVIQDREVTIKGNVMLIK